MCPFIMTHLREQLAFFPLGVVRGGDLAGGSLVHSARLLRNWGFALDTCFQKFHAALCVALVGTVRGKCTCVTNWWFAHD